MVTIKDVARRANVAVSTASYALNGINKVSKSTKEKVILAAQELNYQKNGFASDLKKSGTRTKTIALILSDLSGPFYSELIRGVQDVAMEHGYDLLACSSMGGENSTAAKFLTERRADGCIVLAHNITDEMLHGASSEHYPVVVLDRKLDNKSLVHVEVDNKKGGYNATEYLIKQGHSKIAYVSGPADSYDNQVRFEGYREALEANQIDYETKWAVSGNFTREGGILAANILSAQEERPTAVFFANDEMALGGLEAFQRKGFRVPEDISIIGFDDILEAQYVSPKLTTIRQPKYEMGALATHMVFQIISQEEVSRTYKLHTDLIVRDSAKQLK
ncbi:LacI family DNA-binding transcriptional regulator [Alteribacillus sp. HJP-4]|uniref:LacI family DNA-binding transcriptional regulator n=1 Tax=Alteribacillus sp. HJP-4 TaxID=2775394 RepID=UPI0035CD0EAD